MYADRNCGHNYPEQTPEMGQATCKLIRTDVADQGARLI